MNWIKSFELICYFITIILLIDIVLNKCQQDLYLFVSAAFAGFALELLAVRVTGIYHYSQDFLINIGIAPQQFPFFGGLMWGGLTVYSLRIARKMKFTHIWTALVAAWLIVSMDLLLDVVAIRLDGGFWIWDGRAITLQIDHHMFMSVIWLNFLGYLFETPAILYLTLLFEKKAILMNPVKRLCMALGIGFSGIAFVGLSSGLALLLNSWTDEWFACIAFFLIWNTVLVRIIREITINRSVINLPEAWDWPVLIYWLAIYGYCLAALVHLDIMAAKPLYFVGGIALLAFTVYLIIRKPTDQ